MSTQDDPPSFSDETLPMIRPRKGPRGVPLDQSLFDIAGRTDIGNIREQNEDQFLIADLGRVMYLRATSLAVQERSQPIGGPQGTLLMVADGMGGHGSGDVASSVAIDTIAQFVIYAMPWVPRPDALAEEALLKALGDAMMQCQQRLEQVAVRKHLEHHQMGTTLTLSYVLWPTLYVVHAGDSRCYLCRDGEIHQITRDHTVAEALRERGAFPDEPSPFDHVLVNVVGGGSADLTAEAHRLKLEPEDKVVLCSDGLSQHVTDTEILQHLLTAPSSSVCCERLIDSAKKDGGTDNVTVIVARF